MNWIEPGTVFSFLRNKMKFQRIFFQNSDTISRLLVKVWDKKRPQFFSLPKLNEKIVFSGVLSKFIFERKPTAISCTMKRISRRKLIFLLEKCVILIFFKFSPFLGKRSKTWSFFMRWLTFSNFFNEIINFLSKIIFIPFW